MINRLITPNEAKENSRKCFCTKSEEYYINELYKKIKKDSEEGKTSTSMEGFELEMASKIKKFFVNENWTVMKTLNKGYGYASTYTIHISW